MDAAFKHLELSEQDYFGLQFAQEYSGDVIVSGQSRYFIVLSG